MFRKPIDIGQIMVSSKISLKLSCLSACDNDIERAEKLYQFLAGDLSNLPDIDPMKPSGFQQVKDGATEVFSWVNEHKEDIMKGVQMVQSLRSQGLSKVSESLNIEPIPIPR